MNDDDYKTNLNKTMRRIQTEERLSKIMDKLMEQWIHEFAVSVAVEGTRKEEDFDGFLMEKIAGVQWSS